MANMDLLAQQLASPDIDLRIKCAKASDLRDAVDHLCQGSTYPQFLAKFIPIFTKILEGPTVFDSASWHHRLRNSILEIIHRLPLSPAEYIKPHAGGLVDLLMRLLRKENEDNAVLCMKAIMDLQRVNDESVASKVIPFLGIIEEMFASVGQIVKDTFDNSDQGGSTPAHAPSATPNSQSLSSPRPASPAGPIVSGNNEPGSDNQNRKLAKGMHSFKVLAECPIIVVSLFQTHKQIVPTVIKKFTPLIKEMLQVQAAPQRAAHEEAAKNGEVFSGVCKEIKNKTAFGELVLAQVKTMSFLAYLLRMYEKQFQDFQDQIPDIVVRLLQDCPEDRSAARKELLVAIRHVMNFQWCRVSFIKKLDDLLNDRILLGDGLTVHETMRPLAYSMVADFIHHIREMLSPAQVERAIEVFSKHMLDEFPGTSFQNMSAKLLLNMADSIANLEDKAAARHFLVMIMRAIADKFAMMNREYLSAVKQSKKGTPSTITVTKEDHLMDPSSPPNWDETDIFFATPIKAPLPRDPDKTPVDDNKFVFKHLMSGLKNLFYRLKLTNPEGLKVSPEIQPSNWSETSYGYSAEEVEIITRLFREGAQVFRYFQIDPPIPDVSYSNPVEYWANNYMMSSSKEEKDLLETFATVFHCIDPATFHEVFTKEIPHLYKLTFEHATLLHIPQFFLASEATSPSFSGMLLQFLMGKIEEVGTKDIQKSSILLRLFKLSFMAVTLFSNQNEHVLLPHVTTLVVKSIQLSTKAEEPLNYFYLLRSLFRSIGGGRFEALYKEILPLLEMLLDVLNNLLMSARKTQERYLYVELCLTVPARLSNLLPHLSYLMRPLVVALRADSDLVGQGLRTLELCVDNLTADYLDPILAPVIDDMMHALWDHLKPAPYSHFHSHSTLRILGKLGGRNRKFLTRPPQLEPKPYADDDASFDVKLIGATKGRAFPLTIGIDLAIEKLEEVPNPKKEIEKKNDPFYKQQAFRFICSQTKLHIGYDQLPNEFPQLVRLQADDMTHFKLESASDVMDKFDRDKSMQKKLVQEETLKKLLKSVIFNTTVESVKEDAVKFLENVCQRFMILELGRAMAVEKRHRKEFSLKNGEGPVYLDSKVFAEAIVDLLSHELETVRQTATQAVEKCYKVALTIFSSEPGVQIFPFFGHFIKVSCHNCFEEAWYMKAGGHLGIEFLTTKVDLGDKFYKKRQIDIVRALMFLIKDIPQDLPIHTRVSATETLERVLRRCNKEKFDPEDLKKRNGDFLSLLLSLLPDLSHQVKSVREAAKKAFEVIAETKGVETWELINPLKERLLMPIYGKPLRALQFPVQCGFIDAVTYCLELKHDVVEYNTNFNRLLEETLALTDQEDEKLTAKPNEFRTAESILNCRIASLRLMALALNLPQINQPEQVALWNRIISVFFKSLYSTSAGVSDAANAGLKSVLLAHNKLPKELLQAGLRPILMTLSVPEKITLTALEGLHRLLQLLTNYFKPEIGERLLSYMETFNKPDSLLKTSFSLVEQVPDMKAVIATLGVYHLLPVAAVSMLPKLVGRVMDFEHKLRRTIDSPLRPPLYKFLGKYPQQTWQFFSAKMSDIRFARFFCQLIVDPICAPVADVVAEDGQNVLEHTLSNVQAGEVAHIAGIDLISQISSLKRNWLSDKPAVRKALLESGKRLHSLEKAHKLHAKLRLPARRAGELLIKTLCVYMTNNPDDVDFLFELIVDVTTGRLQMHQSLRHYLYTQTICGDSVDVRKKVALRCLDSYHDGSLKPKTKTFLFQYLLNPIFAFDIMQNWNRENEMTDEDNEAPKLLIDADMIENVHEKLWKANAAVAPVEQNSGQVDQSHLEALQMSALLIKYHRKLINEINESKPAAKLTTNISKFIWAHTQSDETITKYAAFVVFAFMVAQFQSHPKLVMTVYHGLLRAHQTEGRPLVIQALDLMAPVLPERLMKQSEREKVPQWARLPKRAIAEDSSNLQQLISVLQFFIRHADMFYEYRDQYVSSFLPALAKIAQPPSTSQDNRKLVLNVIEMIKNWEERKLVNKGGRKWMVDGSPKSSSPPRQGVNAADDYKIPTSIRMNTIKHLSQLMSTCMERYPVPASEYMPQAKSNPSQPMSSTETVRKTFGLFYDLLSPGIWSDLDIDLFPRMTETILASDRTDKILGTLAQEKVEDKTVTAVVNTLQLVRYILNTKSDEWIQGQMPFIEKILEKPLKSDHMEIQDCLHNANEDMDNKRTIRPLLQRIVEAIPEEKKGEDEMEIETPGTSFLKHLSAMAKEALDSSNYVSGINILWTLSKARPAMIDEHMEILIKVMLQKLTKDHLQHNQLQMQAQQPQQMRPNASEPQFNAAAAETTIQLIHRSIDACASRMAQLGEQRRPFLSVLANLVERSINQPLCEKIIEMVEEWIFESQEPLPNLKEKTAVLHKMVSFEQRQDPTLLHKFLDLVIRIFEDPKTTTTDLTVRLENAFLIGTRAQDVTIRNRFMTIFDKSLTRTANARLSYVLGSQNWDPIADKFWISQTMQLMFGAIDMSAVAFMHPEDIRMLLPTELFTDDARKDDVMLEENFEQLMAAHRKFNASLGDVRLRDLLEPLCQLQHLNENVASQLWSALFPIFWAVLNREEAHNTEKSLVALLTKEHNQKQIDKRPNPVQALLDGAVRVRPRIKLPSHVLKFVARSYDAWYPCLRYLEDSAIDPIIDTVLVRESTLDALTEMYAALSEDDLYYGIWRRRCKFVESNAALSYEQNGMWDKAIKLYEQAQIKARTGTVPFSQAEYMLWEDHWVLCAQKLQQWDILSDFAKHENFNDLLLEASFRNLELWQQSDNLEQINHVIKGVSDSLTPRRAFFQAFMALLKFNERAPQSDFGRASDEAMQLSIRKWHQLPKQITNAHIPILEGFQQLVELHDAQTICSSLHQTRADNLDQKSQELKLLLGSWRDRLPNVWDDINAWQDLVTWRQHIFQLINKTYLNLIPQTQGSNTNSSFAYRGYHETAWIINRFAHVARKHRMPDVCISQLSKIYTLPNIEIQEAFLKLREQAKCHYQSQSELNSGLDVISNTNMNYFAPPQKAEFFTLKGMFLAKLGQKEEADEAFGTALYYDIRLPKAWAEWGHYNDTAFKEQPDNFQHGAHAVSCYLEAASLWKSARSRKLLSRVLWLLGIDNADGKIAKAFLEFKGEQPLWYWITFIPQLLTSLSHREAAICRIILVRIAKIYPQALFFLLRTHKEDMLAIKKQSEDREKLKAKQQQQQQQQQQQTSPKQEKNEGEKGEGSANGQGGSRPATANTDKAEAVNGKAASPKKEGESQAQSNGQSNGQASGDKKEAEKPANSRKQAWEYCDEITQVLKTAFPLLALTMETMVDQIAKHFKCPPDEDAYRLIVALLNDGLSYVSRSATVYQKDSKLPAATEANIKRFAETILPNHIKGAFEADFVANKPTMFQYIQRLRKWRDKFEEKLDRRAQHKSLEELSITLSEFRYNRLDEVEVPGQYLLHKDKNQDFVRIERFLPNVDLVRNVGISHRRLKIRGSDGGVHSFAVHHPAARHIRREERVAQLFRVFNSALSKRKEARRRNLQFYLPAMVPLAPAIRLVQEDSQYVSLQGVYEDYCRRNELDKDEPILFNMEKMRSFVEHLRGQSKSGAESIQQLRLECFTAIQDKFVPDDIALEYFQSIYPSFGDFWLFRRQFTYSFAALTFMTYIMFMTNRTPHKLSISRDTGNVWGTELLPNMTNKAIFHNNDAVPFRLTPNLQKLLGPIAMEGIFGASIMAIARSLTEPEFALDQHLSVFVRDELYNYLLQQRKEAPDNQVREAVQTGSDVIVKRALAFASPPESADLPAHQTVIDKISDAVNPTRLASMDALFMPYL